MASANTAANQDNLLSAVSCVSLTDCTAVGWSNGGFGLTLIEQWDGTSWSIVPSPNTNAYGDELTAVSCPSSTFCAAVGYQGEELASGYAEQTLVEQWDGSSWTVWPSPDATTGYNELSGVSCTSPSDCTAVGYANNSTLVEQWDGSSWSIEPSPDGSGADFSSLTAVSCTPDSACTAVGFVHDTGQSLFVDQTLVEQLVGSTWTIATSPDTSSGQDNQLFGVSCTAAASCTAVGWYNNAADQMQTQGQTLVEQWDGTSWSIVPSPNTDSDWLNATSCTSGSACTAVGGYVSPNHTEDQTLIEQWNGSAWSVVSGANRGQTQGSLSGVACTWATDCDAVGVKQGIWLVPGTENFATQTLAELEVVPPSVTHVSPKSGPTVGGTSVTVTGSGFSGTTGASAVTFGGVDAQSYTVVSDTEITAVTPPEGPGAVAVTVNAPGGSATLALAFTYKAA